MLLDYFLVYFHVIIYIHNINNMVKLPHGKGSIHAKVTGHYNSRWRNTNMRVRDHINTLSFEEQYEYGIEILKQFGWKQ